MVTYLQDDLPTFRDASHLKILKHCQIRSFVTNYKTIAVTSHLTFFIFHFPPLVCQLCIAIAECSDYISAEKDHKTKFSTRKVNPGDPL